MLLLLLWSLINIFVVMITIIVVIYLDKIKKGAATKQLIFE